MSRLCYGWFTALAASLAIAGATPAGAQPGAPAESRPDGRLLRPAADSIVIVVRSAGRADTVGRAFQSLETIGENEWLQVYLSFESDGSTASDSRVMDARTLRPLREARHHALGSLHLTYGASGVRGLVERADGSRRMLDTTFAAPGFASASNDALLRALPLDSGYVAQLDLYYPFPAPFGVRRTEVKVAGVDRVEDSSGEQVECWVVDMISPGSVTRFWIDRATRRLVQVGEGDELMLLFRDVSASRRPSGEGTSFPTPGGQP